MPHKTLTAAQLSPDTARTVLSGPGGDLLICGDSARLLVSPDRHMPLVVLNVQSKVGVKTCHGLDRGQ